MFIIAFILYAATALLAVSALMPDFWVNTNVPAVMGMMLIFFTLSLIMLLRKRAKLFKFLTFYITIFVIVFAALEGVIIYYAFESAPPQKPEYIIVPGSGLYEQNKLTVELEGRLNQAMKLSGEYPELKIILTGGVDKNRGLPQSTAMQEYLKEQYKKSGKKPPAIIIEDKSTNTYENLNLANEKIKSLYKKPIQSAYIVTNSYHCARVKLLSSRIGFQGCIVQADLPLAKYPAYYIRETMELAKSTLLDGFLHR